MHCVFRNMNRKTSWFIYVYWPAGIVHGTTITVLNAAAKKVESGKGNKWNAVFVTAVLGGCLVLNRRREILPAL